MGNVRKLSLTITLLVVIATGFIRDNIFVNLNLQISYLYYQADINYTNNFYQTLFDGITLDTLNNIKWILTGVFTLLYYILCIITTKIWTEKYHWLPITGAYIGLILVSTICFCGGYLLNEMASGYKFARIFMGLLQSPIILMIIIPSLTLYKKGKIT